MTDVTINLVFADGEPESSALTRWSRPCTITAMHTRCRFSVRRHVDLRLQASALCAGSVD